MSPTPDSQSDNEDNYLESEMLIASGGSDPRNTLLGSFSLDEDDYLTTEIIESKRPPKK